MNYKKMMTPMTTTAAKTKTTVMVTRDAHDQHSRDACDDYISYYDNGDDDHDDVCGSDICVSKTVAADDNGSN